MRCYLFAMGTLILLFTAAVAQQPRPPKSLSKQSPPKSPALKLAPSAPDKELVLQMLDTTAAQVQALRDPGLRAYLLLQIAEAYKKADPTKVAPLLADGFRATLEIEGQKFQDEQTKLQLQGWIMDQLRSANPSAADEFVAEAEPMIQQRARLQQISKAITDKNYALAMELIEAAAAQPDGFPYRPASQLMMALPSDADDQRQRIFALALQSYSREEHRALYQIQGEGMGTLIVRFWRRLPAPLVLQAIDTVLDASKQVDNKSGAQLTMASAAGSVSFDSEYELALFLVLPVLKELDPQRADKLLQENADRRAMLNQFPAGMQSLEPTMRDTPPKEGEQRTLSMTFRMRKGGSSAQDRAAAEMASAAADIVKDAEKNPRAALSRAMALPVSSGSFVLPRPTALLGIAKAVKKTNPTVAREAADKLVETAPELRSAVSQAQFVANAVRVYLDLGETQAASKAVAEGIKLAEERYAVDTDSEKPNYGMKGYWPSTAIWRKFVMLAAEISPTAALDAVQQVSERDIQVCLRAALVSHWLGAPINWAGAIEVDKDGKQRSFTSID